MAVDEAIVLDAPAAHLVVQIHRLVGGDLHAEPRRVADARKGVVAQDVAAVDERGAALAARVEGAGVARLERAVGDGVVRDGDLHRVLKVA